MKQRTVTPATTQKARSDGPDPARGVVLRGWLPLTLGLLAVVLGALWTMEGLGQVEGSLLTGQRIWAVIGPLLIAAGAGALWFGMRARR